MSRPRIIPALADLTQDIAGPVPVALLQDWAAGRQDVGAAQSLLDPFRIEGTVVSSDTSGLSKMTEEMDLVRVISLISQPKEIIHGLVVGVGGRPIGLWVADNTESYFPPTLTADDVVQTMWEVQQRIASRCRVRIGMCVHEGSFFEIGGGLYGPDADIVEVLAEDHARGGEIIVTPAIRKKLRQAEYEFTARRDLEELSFHEVHTVLSKKGRPDLQEGNPNYPHAFTDEFLEMVRRLEHAQNPESVITDIYARFLCAGAVVFLARERAEGSNLTTMLDGLLTNALMETIVREGKPGSNLVVCGGGLAILVFQDVGEALDFAFKMRTKIELNDQRVKIGVDYGAILMFNRPDGSKNLMGDPVNVVSKITEDAGEPGKICVTARAAELLTRDWSDAEPFRLNISNVSIQGYVL